MTHIVISNIATDAPSPASTHQDTPPGELLVRIVRTEREFDSLHHAWDDLLGESDARIFQTYEWLHTWWTILGAPDPRRRLFLLMIYQDEILVGIAPFFCETVVVLGPLRYRRLLFIGKDTSDYLDLIARRGKEEFVVDRVARYLADHRTEFNTLQLEDIRDGSPTHLRLHETLLRRGFAGERFLSEYCPRTYLQNTWEETAATFPKSHRNRLLKRMKVVTEEMGIAFEHVTDTASIEGAMDEFITMHQARWNVIGHQGVFAQSATDRFHREVAPHLHRRGWLYLGFLRSKGKRVVGDYGLIFRDECSTYLGGAIGDDEIMRQSPGIVLLMTIMKHCHTLGIRVYDFLRGTERYKYNLAAVDVPNWSLLMYTTPGRLYPILHRAGLLRDALVRRSIHEWSCLVTQAKKHGVVSRGFASYILTRVQTITADAVQKAREPEKTLIIGREQK